MDQVLFSVEKQFTVEFYDVDGMNIAWHGNYVKFMEVGRCALLDTIGYGYKQMVEDNHAFPVIDIKIKYIKSLLFGEICTIRSDLIEYENRLKIKYEIFNSKGELCTKAESTQMSLNLITNESEFVCPQKLIEKVEKLIKK